jgi:hypothetical protein
MTPLTSTLIMESACCPEILVPNFQTTPCHNLNNELMCIFQVPVVIRTILPRQMMWAEHVARTIGTVGEYNFFFYLWVLHPVAHLSNWFFMTPSIATKFQYVNSPFYFNSLHVSATTGHLQVRYTIRYFNRLFLTQRIRCTYAI